MRPAISTTVWFSVDQKRTFLIPDGEDVPIGDVQLHTACGQRRTGDEAALAAYEVSRNEAQAWSKFQLGQVLCLLRNNMVDSASAHFQRKSPSSQESPDELQAHAEAIDTVAAWMAGISTRAEARLRTRSAALRRKAEDAEGSTA